MNRSIITNIIRSIVLILVQILIFKSLTFPVGGIFSIHFLIYPLAILLFPINTPRAITLLSAFFIGLSIDFFYDSPGVHAASLVFVAYFRSIIIAFLEPFTGYSITDVPTLANMGLSWFVSYASISLLIHHFLYFSIDAFSFVYFFEIFLNTIFSFFVSFLVILISQYIVNTKY